MVILDIADKHHPAHVSTLPVYPPLGSTIAVHSAVPLPGRDVVVINSEALRESCDEPAWLRRVVDISRRARPGADFRCSPSPGRRRVTPRRPSAPKAAVSGRTTSISSKASTA